MQGNSPRRVLFASLVGTTIEFFDFYIFANAAVLVFPQLFFPASDPDAATLQSLATFALAFFARPVGSAVFGHFGDRVGRKATLVAALLTMGISTVAIGLLPTYHTAGLLAPALLALCRFGQGFGLGGEWGGAVLLATENAPPGKQNWYGMFPQLGAPIGFVLSAAIFLLLDGTLDESEFLAWGWRIPFLASAALVLVGLYVRLRIEETPAFRRVLANDQRLRLPLLELFRSHGRALVLGTLGAVATFLVFYLMTVFALTWGTSHGYSRAQFLWLLLGAMVFFALAIPLSARLADRFGPRSVLAVAALLMVGFGFAFAPMLEAGGATSVFICLSIGLLLMGLTYGPLGAALGSLFPTAVRYTGASFTFNFAGILGASLTPTVAKWLSDHHGLASVGWYLSGASLLSLVALLLLSRDALAARH
ncbi:MAG: MHS family MFS transporter [Pseudomonadota bacterium]|nr:MHS family MFS transporter [Pseudomonadota bacterium]